MTSPSPAGTAWVSGSGIAHLSLDCSGLARMREFGHDPAEKLNPVDFTALTDLPRLHDAGITTSPCRLCALEPVVDALLTQPRAAGQDQTRFVTFRLSRPANRQIRTKKRYDTSDDRSRALAEEAADRLRRIAAQAGLLTTRTTRGAAAYGFLPEHVISDLALIVQIEVKHTVTQMPSAEVVSTFWSLLTDPTSTLTTAASDDADTPTDPWYIAELVNGVPA